MNNFLFASTLFFISVHFFLSQPVQAQQASWENNLTQIYSLTDTQTYMVVQDCNLYTEGWDLLPQPQFWCRVMGMEKDSSIVNIAVTREVLCYAFTSRIYSMEDGTLEACKDRVGEVYIRDAEEKGYMTAGKHD